MTPMLGCSPEVGAVQFPRFSVGGAVGDMHLHLHQDAVPRHPRAKDRVMSKMFQICIICRGFFTMVNA
ncbi:hypothetical protein ZIOFF_043846 [Zingiber officinale]|uniref:Uncharacterized protein n=1 Tax=Zingiber officinale TaxID=94328 RepID=A0A8J5KQV2_ZINOF|nr:hypothetical protein ZIOFF_043846 [Zingiber officinale]